ncbi:MAG: rRNA maturation RNase YbeY [Proteobacteria bacterium]|nr:rRNA maturation RNase YbeY [Pseudomonadota bacterium]
MPATPKKSNSDQLAVDVTVADRRWIAALPNRKKLAERALRAAWNAAGTEAGPAEVSIRLAADAEVKELNHTYRGIAKPTNVLSFGNDDPAGQGQPRLLGDIVLAFETVAAEAAEKGIAIKDHYCHLLIHGMLHLLGFDHDTDTEADDMESRETSMLAALGIADPYADSAGG